VFSVVPIFLIWVDVEWFCIIYQEPELKPEGVIGIRAASSRYNTIMPMKQHLEV
jgi:hypothetical protein